MKQAALFLKLSHSQKTSDFWVKMLSIARNHIELRKSYVSLVKHELREQSLVEINERLSDPINLETAYVVNDAYGGDSMSQSMQYVERDGYGGLIFSISDCLTSHLELADELSRVFEITNLLIEDLGSGYRRRLRSFLSPPNSNLYLGPGLVNTHYRRYLEGVTSDMYFGEDFWQYASCTKDEVLAQDWLKIRHLLNGVIHVQAWPESFTTAEGEQGVVQRRLLKLLFDIDENKPHGNFTSERSGIYQQSVLASEDGKVISKSGLEEK